MGVYTWSIVLTTNSKLQIKELDKIDGWIDEWVEYLDSMTQWANEWIGISLEASTEVLRVLSRQKCYTELLLYCWHTWPTDSLIRLSKIVFVRILKV